MPWDGTELWVADVQGDGSATNPVRVAGGRTNRSFSRSGRRRASCISFRTRSGWWNLYRWREDGIEASCPMEAEFGLPQWGVRDVDLRV